jgi:ABC-type cobalamin/Fe3+-siderophores transport system ATPase subunit
MPAPASLIGRDQELGGLRERLSDALGGDGELMLVSGEAGVGKTRLLDELCAGAEVPVLRGSASQETTPINREQIAREHVRHLPSTPGAKRVYIQRLVGMGRLPLGSRKPRRAS